VLRAECGGMEMLMKKIRLRTTLSLIFALMVALTVFFVSILSGIFINRQFEEYVKESQKEQARELAESISGNYNENFGGFNIDYVHGMGMYALKEGFIIRLYDKNKNLLWDAEHHDMTLCHNIMSEIVKRMHDTRPSLSGEFVSYSYDLRQGNELNGILEISYYTPYYLDENDFQFISAFNRILCIVGVISVAISAFIGSIIAKRLTVPISDMITSTKAISNGDYSVRINSELKDLEMFELASSIDQMAGALQDQDYLRRQLTEDITHELRTPVTNVSSYIEMMMDDVMEPTPERLKSCYKELSRLTEIINDLEKLKNNETNLGNLEKSCVDLSELAAEILDGFKTKLVEKHITADIIKDTDQDERLCIFADRIRIGQMIANLLSNAIKYSDENGRVIISLKKDTGKVILVVEDKGIGIAKEEQERVFERFYRTDKSRTRKTGGAGIGLSIVKAIVLQHSGSVRCESEQGNGSRFIVTLPSYDTKKVATEYLFDDNEW